MKEVLPLVLTFLLSLQWIKLAESVKNAVGIEKENVNASEKIIEIGDEKIDKFKDLRGDLKEFVNHEAGCQNAFMRYDNLVNSIDNYVQRFVSLFLISSNLQNREVKDLNEEITIDLEISISGQDLTYLQGYSKSSKDSPTLKNFSKLDAIFSKIARLKEKSQMEEALRSSKSFFGSIDIISVLRNPNYYRIFSFLMIFIGIWTLRRYLYGFSFYVFIFVLINSNILWEGLMLYWKKIKETDIKLYVETMQMQNLKAECDPATAGWYSSFLNFLWKNRCIHYYQTLAKRPVEEVSLFHCILDTYMFYLVRKPMQLLGTSVTDFTNELSGSLPWPLNYVVNIPLRLVIVILAAFFIFILCGKRFRLSFWGASVEIGNVKTEPKNEKLFITNNDERAKPIRKLKPWTKSRFQKGWIGDCGKRWKSNIKTSKSLTEMPNEDVSAAGCSSDTKIINQLNND